MQMYGLNRELRENGESQPSTTFELSAKQSIFAET